jgi:anti-sigma factor RsiW
VNCNELKPWLHGYADGELDLVRNLEIEGHIRDCPACAESLRQLQRMRQAFGDGTFYHRAPVELGNRIHAALRRQARPRLALLDLAVRGLAVAASLALVAMLVWGVLRPRSSPSARDLLAQEVVSGHIRSLLVGKDPRVDVASTDRHEVKPWFNGRVPFSPIVRDLDAADYLLVGGRMDYLDNRKVAVVVYKHRKHPINLFTWAERDAANEPPRVQTRQGFQVVHWTQDGMTYWAVSDLNEEELLRFAELIRNGR